MKLRNNRAFKAGALGLSALAISQASMAQSSVLLYGMVDDGLFWLSNVGGKQKLFAYAGGANRFGMKGSEDIGGGNSVFFRLETAFNINNGNLQPAGQGQNLIFGRLAYVGMQSSNAGSVSLGRQQDVVTDYLEPLTASYRLWAAGYGAHFGDVDNFGIDTRYNNSVKYETPTIAGWTGEAAYSVGGVAGQSAQNSGWSLGARYVNGPWRAALGYTTLRNPLAAAYGTSTTGPVVTPSPYANLYNASRLEFGGVGVNYVWNNVDSIGFVYTRSVLVDSALAKGNAVYDNFEVNATYYLRPDIYTGLGYTYTLGSYTTLGKHPVYHQVNTGVGYLLSKRTILYTDVVYQRAARDAPVAQISLFAASSSKNQLGVGFHLKHFF
ncbi:porin [Paraburkholderia sediminicola]|uniref:porin n=1 Tax=Paraburkholderia sediminicola TaxID=458836 RepID=UPI0038BDA7E1